MYKQARKWWILILQYQHTAYIHGMFQCLIYSLADWVSLASYQAMHSRSCLGRKISYTIWYLPDAKVITPQECLVFALLSAHELRTQEDARLRRLNFQEDRHTVAHYMRNLSTQAFLSKENLKPNPNPSHLHILYAKFSQVQERKFQLPFLTLSSTDQSWVSEASTSLTGASFLLATL